MFLFYFSVECSKNQPRLRYSSVCLYKQVELSTTTKRRKIQARRNELTNSDQVNIWSTEQVWNMCKDWETRVPTLSRIRNERPLHCTRHSRLPAPPAGPTFPEVLTAASAGSETGNHLPPPLKFPFSTTSTGRPQVQLSSALPQRMQSSGASWPVGPPPGAGAALWSAEGSNCDAILTRKSPGTMFTHGSRIFGW